MLKKFYDASGCGKFMLLTAFITAFPLIIIPFYPDEAVYIPHFLIPAFISLVSGIIWCILRYTQKKIRNPEDLAWNTSAERSNYTILGVWVWGIFITTLPFVSGCDLKPVHAMFESVSAWTTAGLSVMDLTQTSEIFLFYRSFVQFCGGLGFVIMMMLLFTGKSAMNLFNAEGHPDKLKPSLRKTAQTIVMIYSICMLGGTAAYKAVGMNLLDAVCHSMCALSTGGFSTKMNSIGEYNSVGVEAVTIVLMLIGATNFTILLLMSRFKWKQVLRISEVRFMIALIVLFVPLTAVALSAGTDLSIAEGFRHSAFNIVSAFSTSGFCTIPYQEWPHAALFFMILAMFAGGGVGSTSGGIKLTRVYLIIRLAALNMRRRLSPVSRIDSPYYVKAQGKAPIDDNLAADTTGFVTCYFLLYGAGVFLLMISSGCTMTEAMFEFASCLSTVGLSIGVTSPDASSFTLFIEMAGMILGRLEIFIIFSTIYTCFTDTKKRILYKFSK